MNNVDRITNLKNIQKGEQNRYGEIEYELSDKDRIIGLKSILETASDHPISTEESRIIESIIYWNLCGNISIVEETCKIVNEYYAIESVKYGILEGLKSKYTFHSRVNHLSQVLYNYRKLELSLDNLLKDILPIVDSWIFENDSDRKKVNEVIELYCKK
jgi:hypothetical protein